MKFLINLLFISLFLTTTIIAQNVIDSLENIIDTSSPANRVKLLNQFTEKYINIDLQIADQLGDEYYRLAESIGDKDAKARAAGKLGLIKYFQGLYNQAEYYCLIAQNLSMILQDPELERDVNTTLALVYIEDSLFEKSLNVYNRNLKIDMTASNQNNLAIDYQNLGNIHEMIGNNDMALKYLRNSKELFAATGKEERVMKVYSNIGRLFLKINLDSARYYFSNALAIYQTRSDIADYYEIFWDLSNYYYRTGLPDSAIYYLNIALNKAVGSSNHYMRLKDFLKQSEIYAAVEDYRNAYRFQLAYLQLKDSLIQNERNSDYQRQILKLEEENKAQTVELLKKEAQINSGKPVPGMVIYYLAFGGIFLMVFVFIAFYYRYKLYNKSITLVDKLNKDIGSLTAEITTREEIIAELRKQVPPIKYRNSEGSNPELSLINTAYIQQEIASGLENVLNFFNADLAGMYILNEFQQLINLGELNKQKSGMITGMSLSTELYFQYIKLLRSLEPIISENCVNDSRYKEFVNSRFKNKDHVSRIDIPVYIEKKLIGVIYIESEKPVEEWNHRVLGSAREIMQNFVPLLAKAYQNKSIAINEPIINSKQIINIILNKLNGFIIDKNSEGLIYQVIPENMDNGKTGLIIRPGDNWLSVVVDNQRDDILSIYATGGNDIKNDEFHEYNILDSSGNEFQITEEVISRNQTENEHRIISVVHLSGHNKPENDLKVQVNSLKAVIASLVHGIIVTDTDGKIILINPALEKISGYKSREIISKHISLIFQNENIQIPDLNTDTDTHKVFLLGKAGLKIPCRLVSGAFTIRNIKYFTYQVLANEIIPEHGSLIHSKNEGILGLFDKELRQVVLYHYLLFYRFILNAYYKILPEEIKGLMERYEKSTLQVESIPEAMDYDIDALRKLFTEIIVSGDPDEEFNSIFRIFDLKKSMKDYFVDFNITDKLDILIEKFEVNLNGNIIFHKDLVFNESLNCIAQLLILSIYEIIDNSIKSCKGSGDIYIRCHSANDRFILTVTDTGEGIIPDIRKKLFEQIIPSPSGRYGYGLFIVNKVIIMHAGNIKVRSHLNKGTEIIVEIPIKLR